MEFNNDNNKYVFNKIVAQNKQYRIWTCTDKNGHELLMQVASEQLDSSSISRNAWIINKLAQASDKIHEEHPDASFNYHLGFPKLHDEIVLTNQGVRHANILGFRNVKNIGSVVPLIKIWKDSLRIDLKTSAWIMGKLLKTISFAHDNRIEVNDISGNNILIEPDLHYVIVFNWSKSLICSEEVSASTRRKEVKLAAKCVIKALGGLSYHHDTIESPYVNYLKSLANTGNTDASKAHKLLYTIVDDLCENPFSSWEKGFHEFTTIKK